MKELKYRGIYVRINPLNNNIIENSKDGKNWNPVYQEPTFSNFEDLKAEGPRLYALASGKSVWSTNWGLSWHIS